MTQSMTGFARGSVTTPSFAVIVEIRSVNNRYLDLHFRCPENLRGQEPVWRRKIGDSLNRGKVEVAIRVQGDGSGPALTVNQERVSALQAALTDLSGLFPDATAPDRLSLLMAPGVLSAEEIDEREVAASVAAALDLALKDLIDQRKAEGSKLREMVEHRIDSMSTLLADLRVHLPLLREQQRQRVIDRIQQLGIEPDGKRLEEELVYLAQRTDVDEEIDRLGAHMSAIRESLASNKPCGRRLDFLMQELNREANTLSSKSTALSTTNTAVEFKVLIEQMREQIQNIE